MSLLGLTDPVPVSFGDAEEAVDEDSHSGTERTGRVYVSPALDGWTLVIGRWCDPCDTERSDDVLRLCEALSARYGRAQAYYYGAQGDGSAWLIAEQGTVVRRYCETGEGEDHYLTLGEPLPYERSCREALGLATTWDAATEREEDEDEWAMEAHVHGAGDRRRTRHQSTVPHGRYPVLWHRPPGTHSSQRVLRPQRACPFRARSAGKSRGTAVSGGQRGRRRPPTVIPGQGPYHCGGCGFEPTVTCATTVFKTVPQAARVPDPAPFVIDGAGPG